jgi:uncharacterized protein YwqG
MNPDENRDRPAPENADSHSSPAEPPSDSAESSLPEVPPDMPPPSISLLNQPTHNQSPPPRIAKALLPQARYPLGFVQRELQYCNWQIPLARSLVCFEMVGTFKDVGAGNFTIRLMAQQDIAYSLDVNPRAGTLVHNAFEFGSRGTEERSQLAHSLETGQLFQLVLVLKAKGDFVLYLNNQPFHYCPPFRPAEPIDKLYLNYTASGLTLQQFRVLEPRGADKPAKRAPAAKTASRQRSPKSKTTPPATPMSPTPPQPPELPAFLKDLPPQFEPLRSFLEAHLVPYIKLQTQQAGSLPSGSADADGWDDPLAPWQSKIGGRPYLPRGTSYPADGQTGRMMMFLMQVDCAELPAVEGFKLPKQGLLQFYVGLDVAMCELSPEQHRVLYFPEILKDTRKLVTDFSFLEGPASALEWYDEVYALSFALQQDVFWSTRLELDASFKLPEDLQELGEEFDEWLYDYEQECASQQKRLNKLGGFPETHSTVNETVEDARGRLLLELQHEYNCDDNFYFFVEDRDLANAYFDNIESYFLRN